ncbi:MAG TPA: aspartate aminotransferase, partial [Thermoanaerobaculia bacterium]|nr:aspartate aminotransferase [Thermoanaerobaculia bacterium]
SRTVTCLRPPAGVGAPELVRRMIGRGYRLASGYGKWKPTTFRVGHMGEVREADLSELFEVLQEEIRSCTAS